jgi:hypothetical protein
MNADLTISTLSFTQQYSDKTGSMRREISRGVSLPETMQIKHQSYVDSASKRAGRQSALIFEYNKATTDGEILPVVRGTLKLQVLTDPAVGSTEILAVLERIISTIQEDDTGLDLGDNIFVNQEQ